MMKTIITAETAEQMKAEVLKFLRYRAEQERDRAAVMKRKTSKSFHASRAQLIEDLMDELYAAEVSPGSQ